MGVRTGAVRSRQVRAVNDVDCDGAHASTKRAGDRALSTHRILHGEELPKVMYRLVGADHYINKQILLAGGCDSAVEAAMGLAFQLATK